MNLIDLAATKVAVDVKTHRPGGFIHTARNNACLFDWNTVDEYYIDWSDVTMVRSEFEFFIDYYTRALKPDGRIDLYGPLGLSKDHITQILAHFRLWNIQSMPTNDNYILALKKVS